MTASTGGPGHASTIDWPAIERAYRSGEGTIAEIAARYHVAARTIYTYARKAGWPSRRDINVEQRSLARSRAGRAPPRRRTLITRLIAAVDRQIAEIEARLRDSEAEGAAPDAATRERDARTLASLTRTLERLTLLKREDDLDRAKRRTAGTAADAALAAELERRLARLAAEAGPPALPSEPEP